MDCKQFTHQGITYRQEYRRCTSPKCKCATDPEHKHGPYWYATQTGSRPKYIGKNLPESVINAYNSTKQHEKIINTSIEKTDARATELETMAADLRKCIQALQRLKHGMALDTRDIEVIKAHGLSDCLIDGVNQDATLK